MKKIKVKQKLSNAKPPVIIVAYYILSIFVSVILLSLPQVYKPGVAIPFIDKVFTAVSAVSVTGLTVADISETFSTFGIVILMIIFQFGGIGVMALGTFFWLLFRRKIGLKERRLIMADQNQPSLSGVVYLIKDLLKILLLIELIGTIILSLYFLQFYSWEDAVLHGLFAAVSATTNAGFDITGSSFIYFAGDYFVQFILISLIILGAIGFPVLVEVKEFLFSRKPIENFRFSLFTKLTSITFFSLLIFGTVIIFLLEWSHSLNGISWDQAFFYAFFQSVSARSAGLVTIDVSQFSQPTLLVLSGLMFIGASPSSVGGGIRTTTFAICILYLYHFAKGSRTIRIFHREIHEDDIRKSVAVMMFSILLLFIVLVILSVVEDIPLMPLLFEICSAFGTTGMSLGITDQLSTFGKCLIMLLMFVGRIGVLSFLYIIGGKEKHPKFRYPKEKIIIG